MATLRRFIVPVPGDADTYRGIDWPYKNPRLVFQRPDLEQLRGSTLYGPPRAIHSVAKWPRGIFYQTAPAAQVLIRPPTGSMGGPPDAPQTRFRGLVPSYLFPLVEKRKPWER